MAGSALGLPAAAAALPAVACTGLLLAFAGAEWRGATPLSITGRPLNIAEAAGTGNGAEVFRLLEAGAAADRMLPVRPEIISSSVTSVTALEAAVLSDKVEIVVLLDDRGLLTGETRTSLACLARDVEAEDAAAYLGTPTCEAGVARAAILARSSVPASR